MNDRPPPPPGPSGGADATSLARSLADWWAAWRKSRNGQVSTREALQELIESDTGAHPIGREERTILANVLELRGSTVADVMVPRVDIIAVEAHSSWDDVIALMTKSGHSRLPVFRQTLDDVIGMVHVKDVIALRGQAKLFALVDIVRRVLFVAPSMRVLELLLEMRVTRSHMALVVDEYGGVDGLVTIEDLVGEIVGEIADEHDTDVEPKIMRAANGTLEADARVSLEALEEMVGPVLSDDERRSADTLGGLVAALAGRMPIRGELVTHPSGLEFEIVDVDPRRVKRLRLRLRRSSEQSPPPAH